MGRFSFKYNNTEKDFSKCVRGEINLYLLKNNKQVLVHKSIEQNAFEP